MSSLSFSPAPSAPAAICRQTFLDLSKELTHSSKFRGVFPECSTLLDSVQHLYKTEHAFADRVHICINICKQYPATVHVCYHFCFFCFLGGGGSKDASTFFSLRSRPMQVISVTQPTTRYIFAVRVGCTGKILVPISTSGGAVWRRCS